MKHEAGARATPPPRFSSPCATAAPGGALLFSFSSSSLLNCSPTGARATPPARFLLLLALALLVSACYKGQEKYPPADNSSYNVPYASGLPGQERLTLDVHWPHHANHAPVIMYIHGGGWSAGDKKQMDVWSKRIAREGYVVFNINYRLAPAYPFPAAVNDCLGALAWIQDHARDYGGDPDRLGVTGGSAGGHLTAMVATAAADPRFVPTGHPNARLDGLVKAQAPFFGVFDLNQPGFFAFTNLRQQFIGAKPDQNPDAYRAASPVNYVTPNTVPTLIVCGKLDPIHDQSKLYYHALQNAGADVQFITYPLQTHAFESFMYTKDSQDAFVKMIDFFDQNLQRK